MEDRAQPLVYLANGIGTGGGKRKSGRERWLDSLLCTQNFFDNLSTEREGCILSLAVTNRTFGGDWLNYKLADRVNRDQVGTESWEHLHVHAISGL